MAHSRTPHPGGRTVADVVGEFAIEQLRFWTSTVKAVWDDGERTMLHQVVVTTFAHQTDSHVDALRHVGSGPGLEPSAPLGI